MSGAGARLADRLYAYGVRIPRTALANVRSNGGTDLTYVVEDAGWSIRDDGMRLTAALDRAGLLRARIAGHPFGVRRQIVHFGSLNTFATGRGFRRVHASNRTVVTVFHITPGDRRADLLAGVQDRIDVFHTSCRRTAGELSSRGIAPEKIVVIPLGVDTGLFRPPTPEERERVRTRLGIPRDRVVVGSFQKDGTGWGDGMEPKMIKGPDVFVETARRLARTYPVFVLLTGPARGYVRRELEKAGIPYRHAGYGSGLETVARCYRALDLYLIGSRVEGGPKQVLEAWASGVPLVSTRVGMVPDIAEDGADALLADSGDVAGLVRQAERALGDAALRERMARRGLETVRRFTWDAVAARYHRELYKGSNGH